MRWILVAGLSVAFGCSSSRTPAENVGDAMKNDASALFAGLPAPVIHASEPVGETLRLGPVAKPAPNETALPFPPEEEPIKPQPPLPPPLAVVRHSPEGDVDLVDQVLVSFNQPMVPLASVGELATAQSPLQLSPLPAGRFRWLDTQTIVFQAEGRMPYATRFTARVPAGVVSAAGQVLESEEVWTLTTPRPAVVEVRPYNNARQVKADDAIDLRFNVAVDSKSVAAKLSVTGKDNRSVPFEVTRLTGDEKPSHWEESRSVRIKPSLPLPLDTEWTLTLLPGVKSDEGPDTTERTWSTKFHTYAPFVVEKAECGWSRGGDKLCYPGSGLAIVFNNNLAQQALVPLVRVQPAVENLVIHNNGSRIALTGNFVGDTTYALSVDSGLSDTFGQRLSRGSTHTLRMGTLDPRLELSGAGSSVVLRSGRSTTLPGFAVNTRAATLRLTPVHPSEVTHVLDWVRSYQNTALEGTEAATAQSEISPTTRANVQQAFEVDVHPALGATGHGFVAVELEAREEDHRRSRQRTFVQVTDLGLTATWSGDRLHVMVASLSTGSPVADAAVELRLGKQKIAARTDAQGFAQLGFTERRIDSRAILLVSAMDDFAFLDVGTNAGYGAPLSHLVGQQPEKILVGSVFSDRGVYRPGETAHVTAYLQQAEPGPKGDIAPLPAKTSVDVVVRDARWNEVMKTTVELGAFGTVGLDLPIAADASLGSWQVEATVSGRGTVVGAFDVREYRTPEFRVSTKVLGEAPFRVGTEPSFRVEASYFFGAPMSGAAFAWTVRRSSLDYRPPGNDGFRFGVAPPWWKRGRGRPGQGTDLIKSGAGVLDAKGSANVSSPLTPGENNQPAFAYEFEATVTDATRQQIASRTSLVGHRTLKRVGIQVERGVVSSGADIPVDVIVTTLDGKRLANEKVSVSLIELRPKPDPDADSSGTGDDRFERIEADTCAVTTTGTKVICRVHAPKAGEYVVQATLVTEHGNDTAELTVWATGKGMLPDVSQAQTVLVVPDKEVYEAGDTARVLVRSPFPQARGFFFVGREGFADVQPFETLDGTAVIEFPVRGEWMPSVELGAIVSSVERVLQNEDRADWASGSATLSVSTASRRLAVTVETDPSTTRPGADVAISVTTRDASGKPRASGVTLMVVDEAVLSLTGFETPSPLSAVYQPRQSGVGAQDLRAQVLIRQAFEESMNAPEVQAQAMRGGAMKRTSSSEREFAFSPSAAPATASGASEMAVRETFRSTAFFERTVRTGSNGHATVHFKLPDNLTEFRVMAVATDGEREFGSDESTVVVRQPLIVRPSLPRFLNVGDRFEASAVVNNETGRDAKVVVRMLAVNAVIDAPLQTVKLAVGQSKELRWKASAGTPGPAKFQVAAVEPGIERYSDAAEIVVPTLLPATAEAFATYGSTLGSVQQPVSPPMDALPGFGGLQVSMSSTALTGLEDAARYLLDYPFMCVEQVTSRLMPQIALGELLGEFNIASAKTPEERKKSVERDIEFLTNAQRSDGGFPSWSGGDKSWVHITTYVAFVLQEAQAASFAVNRFTLDAALGFLANRLANPADEWERNDGASRALAALVFARAGRFDRALLGELANAQLPLFAKAWLLEAFSLAGDEVQVAKLLREIENAAVETASSAHFSEHRSENLRLIMHSNDRTDAIVLRALLKVKPDNALIEKVQRGLQGLRKRGHWSTTQANAWSLLAMRDYFNQFEAETPSFQARVWVGDTYAGGTSFEGRSTETSTVEVPMATLQTAGAGDLLLAKEGDGRLYYRLGLRYAPKSLSLDALDAGFAVTRRYAGLDDPNDVARDEDGTWRVKAGARVGVHLQVGAPDRRFWVALVDPMPAGFEAVDTALATSRSTDGGRHSQGGLSSPRWWSTWNHEELRDDQARAFADTLWGGVWTHEYVALATTPGEFVVPPARAEEMYAPETFGRTRTDRVVIVP